MSNVIVKPVPYSVDLNEPIKKTYIDTLLATEDNLAQRFDISLLKGGEAVALPGGAAVTAYFIRYSDNATVPITNGTISGNVARITLTSACYNKPGQFAIIIKISGDGGIKNTVFYGEGTVFTSSTDTIVDEENVVPSLSDLLAQIEAMETATEAAKTATTNAESATTKANNATTSANNAASAANTAAEAANAAAQNWSDGTAANAIQLNGKSADYYAKAVPVISEISDAEAETSAKGHLIDAYVVKQLLDRFVTETATVAMNSAYASGNVTIKKSGNVVSVMVPNTAFSNLTTGADNIIATIPAAYKPSASLFYVIKNDRGTMYMGTGGQIVFLPTSESVYAEAFFTYVI